MIMSTYEQFQEQINNFFSKAKGDLINKCYWLQDFIENLEGEAKIGAFIYAVKNVKRIDTSEERDVDINIDTKLKRELHDKYEKLVDGIMNSLIASNLSENEYYQKLWDSIFKTPLFPDAFSKTYGLYSIIADGRTPYYQLGIGLKMSNEEYKTICEKIDSDLEKVDFILSVKFSQKTERASLLVNLLESQTSIKEKSILMARIIARAKTSLTGESIDIERLSSLFRPE